MAGSGVTLYATTSGGNKVVIGSIDWREDTYMPSQINDNVSQIMADIRALANNIASGWIEIGDTDGVYTPTYISATSFRIDGADVTAYYRTGMRVRVVAPTPGTLTGTITSSAFSTHTTLVVAWDSGALSNEAITSVSIGVASGDTAAAVGLTRHDCRFDYVNGTTCRLSRWGGNQITIDAQVRTIPAAGVDLAFDGSWAPAGVVLYVYAYMNAGAIALYVSATAPATDARDGNSVMTGSASMTLVGMIVGGYGSFIQDASRIGVISCWNRRARAIVSAWSGVSSASTTVVILASGTQYVLAWGEEATQTFITGYGNNSGGITSMFIDSFVDGAGSAGPCVAHCGGAGYNVPQVMSHAPMLAAGWHQISPYVAVSAGAGLWYGMQSTVVRG